MRRAIDSFLHLLADNLIDITWHPIRVDKNHPENEILQMNAVNVSFVISDFRVQVSQVYTSIDVVNDSELTAIDQATEIATLLQASGVSPLMDYSGVTATPPTLPVRVGSKNIFWNPNALRFRPIGTNDAYYRSNCTLVLNLNL
jgi:hypothetical protein